MSSIASKLKDLSTIKKELKEALEYIGNENVTDVFSTYPGLVHVGLIDAPDDYVSEFAKYVVAGPDITEIVGEQLYIYDSKKCIYDTEEQHLVKADLKEIKDKSKFTPQTFAGKFADSATEDDYKYNNGYTSYDFADKVNEDKTFCFELPDTVTHLRMMNRKIEEIYHIPISVTRLRDSMQCRTLKNFEFPDGDTWTIDDLCGCFMYSLIEHLNLKNVVMHSFNPSDSFYPNMSSMCRSLTSLKSLDLPKNYSDVKDFNNMCVGCSNLECINFGTHDFTDANLENFLYRCPNLTTVTGQLSGLNQYIDIHYSSKLTHDSAMCFINGLTTGGRLILSSTTFNLLSEEDLAIATSKGGTVTAS